MKVIFFALSIIDVSSASPSYFIQLNICSCAWSNSSIAERSGYLIMAILILRSRFFKGACSQVYVSHHDDIYIYLLIQHTYLMFRSMSQPDLPDVAMTSLFRNQVLN